MASALMKVGYSLRRGRAFGFQEPRLCDPPPDAPTLAPPSSARAATKLNAHVPRLSEPRRDDDDGEKPAAASLGQRRTPRARQAGAARLVAQLSLLPIANTAPYAAELCCVSVVKLSFLARAYDSDRWRRHAHFFGSRVACQRCVDTPELRHLCDSSVPLVAPSRYSFSSPAAPLRIRRIQTRAELAGLA